LSDIKYLITVDAAGAVTSIKNFEGAIGDAEKSAGKADPAFGGMFKQIFAGVTAANLAQSALRFVKDTIVDSIKEAVDYEKAWKGMNSAFEISGRNMPGMTKNLKDYANEIQGLGLADDGAILKAEKMLLQFTALDEKGIKVAIRGAIGLANAYEMDLGSAIEIVKNGMEGNYRSLNTMIPAVRNATTEEGKHAAMLEKFDDLYKDAIAGTDTLAGQTNLLNLEWKETKRIIGENIISTAQLKEGTADLIEVMREARGLFIDTAEAEKKDIEVQNKRYEVLKLVADAMHLSGVGLANLILAHDGYQKGMNQGTLATYQWIKAGNEGIDAQVALAAAEDIVAKKMAASKKGYTETGAAVQTYSEEFIKARDAISADIAKATLSDYEAEKQGAILATKAKIAEYEKLQLKTGELGQLRAAAEAALSAQLVAIDRTYAQKIIDERSKMNASIMKLGVDSYRAEVNSASMEYMLKEQLYFKTYGASKTYDELKAKARQEMAAKILAIDKKAANDSAQLDLDVYNSAKDEQTKVIALWVDEVAKRKEIDQMKRKLSMTAHDYNLSVIKDEEAVAIAAIEKDGPLTKAQYDHRLAIIKEYYAAKAALDKKDTAAALAAFSAGFAGMSEIIGGLGQLNANVYQGMMNDVDAWYKKQQDIINALPVDEDTKNKKMDALSKEYEARKKQVQRQAFKDQQSIAVAQAIMNMATAITAAWALGPLLGAISAGLAAIMCGIQIAVIKSQPIPLAKGAIFKSQTQLTSGSGQSYDVAEAGEPEILSSPKRLREAIYGGKGGGGQIIHIPISIGGQKIQEYIIEVVQDASDTNRIKIKSRAVS
jgi:hypothetical protein